MLKSKLLLYLALVFFSVSITTYARPPIVMITGDILNNTSSIWHSHYNLEVYKGYPAMVDTNMNFKQKNAKGRFLVSLPIGQTTYLSIPDYSNEHFGSHFCNLQIKAISLSHVSISQIYAANNLDTLCHYSGNPDNNTAKIVLTDNPAYQHK